MTGTCSLTECDRPKHAKGYCKRHYQQQWSTGSPEIVRPNPRGTPEERFWAKVTKRGDDECWEWTGRTDKDGYGNIRVGTTQVRAHRFSFELHHGATELFVRHRCNNPPCTNPAHLIEGTHQQNMDDRAAAGHYDYETCRRGHPWTDENTIRQGPGKRNRTCRTCRRMSVARRKGDAA